MDRSNDHVSIDFEKLANSLRGKFETLHDLSEDCCIYRVPPKIRMSNANYYTPRIVSIGPLHHGREELKAMEEYKLRYLQQFLGRTRVSMVDFLKFIREKERDLYNCYAETINFGSEEFVEMVLLDAVFLIEILLRSIPQFNSVDRIFTRPKMIKDVVLDIMLLENQLPLFILEDLFIKANLTLPERYERYSLSQFVWFFFNTIWKDIWIDDTLFESFFSEAKHFVDLLRLCLKPRERNDTERQPDPETTPNVTELHQAGIKFKLVLGKNLLDIGFSKRTLEIPVGYMTMQLLINLQIFEALHCDTNYINDYNEILNHLLRTPKDVELLIHEGVIENQILASKDISAFFQELSMDTRKEYRNFYYSGLVKDLKDYCKSPCHKWKTNLKQNYFNTPWASISVIAAVIILILTFIQAVCSIIGVL